MTDQPKLCPGCGGEMRGSETAYPCGRKPVAGSLETTQCVRHQLFDARAKVAELRTVADVMASALHKAISAMAVVEVASEEDDETLGDASDACLNALAEHRKTVS